MSSYPLSTRRRRGPVAVLAALGVALAVTLTACGGSGGDGSTNASTTSSSAAVLKWATTYFPAHWDPVVNGSGATFRLGALAYASLTTMNEKGEAAPGLAESWDYSNRFRIVT